MKLLEKKNANYDDGRGEDDRMFKLTPVCVLRITTYTVLDTVFGKFLNSLMGLC